MKFVRHLVVAAATLGFAASAHAATHSEGSIITQVGEADLNDLVVALGDTVDEAHPFDDPSVRAKTKDGLKYLLIATDCPTGSKTGCKSVMMQVRYTADDEVTLKGINDAAYGEAAVSTWWDQEGGTVGFTRFVHLEGGVTWSNLKNNVQLLVAAHWNSLDVVWPPKKK